MQTESVLQTKNRSEPAKNRFSVVLAIATERVILGLPGNFIGGKCMV